MAIKINLESTKIPVEIGDLKFEIDVDDKLYDNFVRKFNSFLNEIEKMKSDENQTLDFVKNSLKNLYDNLLGLGTYEKIYSQMPNTAFMTKTLFALINDLDKVLKASISK